MPSSILTAAGLLKVAGLLACLVPGVAAAAATPDPARQDILVDRASPPGLVELTIPSDGALMNGHLYTANGPGPHPTVVFLHGFPGNEKNLDLAQAVRRAGFNVLYFHYRGAWGSGGAYSIKHILEDARAAVRFVRDAGAAGAHKIDPARVSLFGHSLGGFNALMTGADDNQITCTVAAASANLVRFVEGADPEAVVSAAASAPVPGLDGYSYGDLVRETRENATAFSLESKMSAFGARPVLIVSGEHDSVVSMASQMPLGAAAETAGVSNYQHLVMDADHSFSWNRISFSVAVTGWLTDNCQ